MPEDDPPFRLAVPSDPRLLGLTRQFVETACRLVELPCPLVEAVVLAVHEAVQNVIRHAHCGRPDAVVEIVCRPIGDGGIEISVLDEGEPFDLAAVPHLRPGELRIGGRGVFLMRTLMDELTCRPRPVRGNELRMIKRCECGKSA
jgi:anti-sigma regulatory factor (Ser/Thr protein kinase)